MNKSELLTRIYNGEIKEDNVVIEHDKEEPEYDRYIQNDGFDYWYYNGDGVISLNFITKDKYDENYEYIIISTEEFKNIIKNKENQDKIRRLKEELKRLEEN